MAPSKAKLWLYRAWVNLYKGLQGINYTTSIWNFCWCRVSTPHSVSFFQCSHLFSLVPFPVSPAYAPSSAPFFLYPSASPSLWVSNAAVWFLTWVQTWTKENLTQVWSKVWGWGWTGPKVQFEVQEGPRNGEPVWMGPNLWTWRLSI